MAKGMLRNALGSLSNAFATMAPPTNRKLTNRELRRVPRQAAGRLGEAMQNAIKAGGTGNAILDRVGMALAKQLTKPQTAAQRLRDQQERNAAATAAERARRTLQQRLRGGKPSLAEMSRIVNLGKARPRTAVVDREQARRDLQARLRKGKASPREIAEMARIANLGKRKSGIRPLIQPAAGPAKKKPPMRFLAFPKFATNENAGTMTGLLEFAAQMMKAPFEKGKDDPLVVATTAQTKAIDLSKTAISKNTTALSLLSTKGIPLRFSEAS